ncbi:hypothetical protein CesoFtcFv8_003228 [Champsocephalus esox]|uniref:Uncharacterized protein n=1 Tax=Champsocephalus esox TaxID=159716 RepID=A0AAN8CXX3_9TELE|nr:hypothetical protein CesoFtcFv8_003228 [Champsocephalus esox]
MHSKEIDIFLGKIITAQAHKDTNPSEDVPTGIISFLKESRWQPQAPKYQNPQQLGIRRPTSLSIIPDTCSLTHTQV